MSKTPIPESVKRDLWFAVMADVSSQDATRYSLIMA